MKWCGQPYLDEMGRYKICKASATGTLPPTLEQLRKYCYRDAYACPVLKAFLARQEQQGETQIQAQSDVATDQRDQGLY